MILLLVAAIAGTQNLYYRGDYKIFFNEENKMLAAFDEIEATFNKTDNLSIIVAPKNGDIFEARYLDLIRQITEEAWQTPYSSRVDSIANYQHTEAVEDDLLVEDLIGRYNALSASDISDIKRVALNEPRLVNASVSENGDVAVVNITVQIQELDKTAAELEIKAFSDALVDKFAADYTDVDFHQTGIVALNGAFNDAAQQDASTLVPTMFLVILIFLAVMLRSVVAVVTTLIVIIGTIGATLGLAGWNGMFLSIGTVNVPTLVMTLAVADCVHVFATIKQQMQLGKDKQSAILQSLKLNTRPVIITSVTTAIGFFMMNASDSPVLRDMGNVSAVGVMVACVLSLTLLPALVRVLPVRVKEKPASEQGTFLSQLADTVIKYHTQIFVSMFALTIVAGFLVTQNRVNDESNKYFDTSSEFRQAVDFMEEKISGNSSISLMIKTNESQGISEPSFIATIGELTDWLRDQPDVDHVSALSDTYRRLNKNMHADNEAYFVLPTDRELASQYLLLYEMSLPYGLDLNNEVNIDKSSLKLQITVANLGSKEMVALEERIYAWFAANAPTYDIQASSPTLMFAHIGETNMKSMLTSLPIALLMISALLIFALRSWRLGLISLIPNMIPAIFGFGLWALISGEINLGLSVVVSLTLGIVVDDSVHFLSKYQHARVRGMTTEQAIHYAFNTVGRALWITTVVLVAGFLVLASSNFRLNGDMGQLSALVIFLALVIDFLLLPAALLKFDRREMTELADAKQPKEKALALNPQN
ncbi:efflux RND transporter permease subunit [Thaumasiovibrio subtropicus]|uniref:efflux RND transporter permease subunit n=1 Tax=Thaumasiovibrio subtropicus TaxID=1891207 RepID=UPI000B3599FD|nr:MMPL family transporter [Thaumasiovibrio subtropicus]